jgi:hypothetical protein
MKKIRLLILFLMLVSGSFMYNDTNFNSNIKVRACAEDDKPECKKGSDRPKGCKCCSDNQCASYNCIEGTDKCGDPKQPREIGEGGVEV